MSVIPSSKCLSNLKFCKHVLPCESGPAGENWATLPVDPSAGSSSRTVSFSPASVRDLERIKEQIDRHEGGDVCAVIIPSWRHHVLQYDCLAASLGALDISTAVSALSDGLWAYLLRRLKVYTLRQAARQGVLESVVASALTPVFARLDAIVREHSVPNKGQRIIIIASDDAAWLVKAFVNSRSSGWLDEVPLDAVVLVGNWHKSIVGELALEVFGRPPRQAEGHEEVSIPSRYVKFFSLNGREGIAYVTGDELTGDANSRVPEVSITCISFEEDSESCILQEFDLGSSKRLSLLESTSMLGLWVPRVVCN